jgi:hypothetical protein
VPNYPVTFSFPPVAPNATFTPQGGNPVTSLTIMTTAGGVAAVPATTVVKASSAAGSFFLDITGPGAPKRQIAFASQYGVSTFGSPVNNGTGVINGGSGNLPLKFSALQANGALLSDADASTLLGQVQLRYRVNSPQGPWVASPLQARYDASRHYFTIDLKTTSLGMRKGTVYEVQVRVLPGAARPPGWDAATHPFDLGSRSLLVKAQK